MNRSFFTLAASFALVGASHASIIFDNFESYNSPLDDMNGKGGWTVSNNSGNVPVILDTYTWDSSTRSATVGGETPGAGTLTSLSHSSTVPLVSLTPQSTYFQIETAYTESTSGPRNEFQFVLNSGASNVLTIKFQPGAAGEYDVSWDSDFVAGSFSAFGTLTANTSTQFRFDTFASGLDVGYSLTNAGSPVSSGILTGASPTAILDTFSVEWDTTSGIGNNSITIDNVALVPEPSSALLGMLGASFAFLRRRRA